ncbi:MAG TPA: hypothetical protein EYP14_10995 [Planctomycetaceae bacterium]|nr:hypothetical protein [Planctomycetaceae bacterium]
MASFPRVHRAVIAVIVVAAWAPVTPAAEKSGKPAKPPAKKAAPKKITYEEHVKPILREKCFTCHNPDKKSNDLDLTSYATLMEGGASGEVIEPGSAEDSYLFLLVSHEEEPYMPPESDRLSDEKLAVIKAWIDGGALEHSGSKAAAPKKPAVDLTLSAAPMEKPAVVAMPKDWPDQPVVIPQRAGAVTALATSPWAPLVAVAGHKQILLYHTGTLKRLGVLPFPEGTPHVLRFSRNGSLLLAGGGRGGASGRTVVWDVTTGKRLFAVGDELDAVLAADISADQALIALGSPLRVVRVYSTADGALVYQFRKHTDWIYAVAFSPDGVLLATADRNGGLYVLEAETGRQYLELKGHTKAVTALAWRPDSNVLASASEDGTIRLWEMENGRQVKNWRAHGGVLSIEFTRAGQLVSCGRDRLTRLWTQNGKAVRTFPAFSDIALRVTYCDETNRVIAGDWTGDVRVWNAADGKLLGRLPTNPSAPSRKTTQR